MHARYRHWCNFAGRFVRQSSWVHLVFRGPDQWLTGSSACWFIENTQGKKGCPAGIRMRGISCIDHITLLSVMLTLYRTQITRNLLSGILSRLGATPSRNPFGTSDLDYARRFLRSQPTAQAVEKEVPIKVLTTFD